jgi:hypothetical protein
MKNIFDFGRLLQILHNNQLYLFIVVQFFSFIVVGHSFGTAWAFLNAGYLTSLNDINQPMTTIYTFGELFTRFRIIC